MDIRSQKRRNPLNRLAVCVMTSVLVLTSCSQKPFMDSLQQENYETIRKSTYFEGSSDIISREEFEGYKNEIVKAIKGETVSNAKVETSVLGDKVIVIPYTLVIKDTSPEMRVFIDDKETEVKVENGMKLILLPGKHKIKYQLITPYYKEDREKEIDTATFKDNSLEDTTGFGFRDFTVTTDDVGSFLVINNNSYMALNQGSNTIKNLPGVKLPMYSKAENDESYVSETVEVDGSKVTVNLKLSKRLNQADTQPTGNTKPIVITAPKNTKPGQTALPQAPVEGLEQSPEGYTTNVSILKKSAEDSLALTKKVRTSLEEMQKNLATDISYGEYGIGTANYILKGSNIEFYIKQYIANELNTESGYRLGTVAVNQIIFTDESNGYVDFGVRIEDTMDGEKVGERNERHRYHFSVGKDGTVLFTRYEKVN